MGKEEDKEDDDNIHRIRARIAFFLWGRNNKPLLKERRGGGMGKEKDATKAVSSGGVRDSSGEVNESLT